MAEDTTESSGGPVNKITSKVICGSIKKPTEVTGLYIVYGNVRATKVSDKGAFEPSLALIGSFEAIRLSDGVVFEAECAYLPRAISENIEAQLKMPGVESLDFSIEVGVRPSEKTKQGYEYYTKPVRDPSKADPLMQLRQLTHNALKALPPPVKPAKK